MRMYWQDDVIVHTGWYSLKVAVMGTSTFCTETPQSGWFLDQFILESTHHVGVLTDRNIFFQRKTAQDLALANTVELF